MAFSLKGIVLPYKKNTAGMEAEELVSKSTVTLPVLTHNGNPAIPVVKVGDEVKVGTLVARAGEGISTPVYSSVSGKVKGLTEIVNSAGKKIAAVTVESDGEMNVDESITPPVINSKADVVEAIKSSGVVGLGGAGFPTYYKFGTDKKVDCLVINATECEPFILSDSYTMINKHEDIAYAIDVITKHFGFEKIIIALEKNSSEALVKMQELAAARSNVTVEKLKNVYPYGAEKALVYCTTGRKVGAYMLPADVGCIVCNVTTIAAIGYYFKTGMPLVKKCITVDGSAVKTPNIVIAPIGVPISEVFEAAGGFASEPGKVIYGGPMMGVSVPTLNEPVLKQTNALIALNEKDSKPFKATACIQCGTCTNNCPFGIDAAEIVRAYDKGEFERLEKLGIALCMECGCCAYGCPAKRPLVQTIKMAKLAYNAWKEKEADA